MNAAVKTMKSGFLSGSWQLNTEWIKQNRMLVLLWTVIVISTLSVVYITNETRIAYALLQTQHNEREALQVEWGQLLLEQGAWTSQARVEDAAERYLSMGVPVGKSTIIVAR